MQANIHPSYQTITVKCSCGHEFTTGSALDSDNLSIEVCSNCHPFYTGQQKVIDTAGRIDRYRRKFGKLATQQKTDTDSSKQSEIVYV